MEHLTGLIIPTSTKEPDLVTIPLNSEILSPQIVEALQILRDTNPHLGRKLNHGITVDPARNTDKCLAYWNRIQEIVVLHDNNDNLEESKESKSQGQGCLKGINLGGLMVRITDMTSFFQYLHDHDMPLQMLNLGGTDIPMNNLLLSLKHINDSKSHSLDSLFLGGCGISSRKGVDDLIQLLELSVCSNVHKLDLRYNDLNGNDIEKMIPILSSNDCKLQVLHLEGNSLKSDGAKAIGAILSKTKSLKELYLGANGITAEGAIYLAEGLSKNTSLETLYLDGNMVGDQGADAFREVLLDQTDKKCKNLKHLYVENNGIGKSSSIKLGRALNSDNVIGESMF